MMKDKEIFKSLAIVFLPTLLLSLVLSANNVTKFVQSTANGTVKTVIIDAGHGGEDGGAVGVDDVVEKDLNLPIALKVASNLEKAGYDVVLTRDGDYAVYTEEANTLREKKVSDIHNRFNLIEKTPDCIFVSIHMNHYDSASCKGAQTFYSGNNEESKILAESIQSSIKELVQPENERVIKESDSSIYVLYYAKAPAVLVECGFISNPEEAALLQQKDYQNKIADAVCKGIIKYCEE